MKQYGGFERNILNKFIMTAIIPIVLLLIVFSFLLWYSARTVTRKNTDDASRQVGEQLRQMSNAYKAECTALSESKVVRDYIRTGAGSEKVFEEYYSSVSGQEFRYNFALIDMDRNILIKNNHRDNYKADYSLWQLESDAEKGLRSVERIFSRRSEEKVQYFTGYGTVIYDDGTPIGYVVYYIDDRGLEKMLGGNGAEEIIVTNEFDTVYATTWEYARNDYNKIIFSIDKSGNIELDGRDYYVSIFELNDCGYKVYACGSRTYERYILRIAVPFIIVVVLLLSIFMFKFARNMSKQVTEPIAKFRDAVKQTGKGKFDVSLDLHTGDEFEILACEYNRMVRKVDQLIVSNNEKEELRRQAEFKVIRNQFNPHFIFNVLETLRYMVFVDPKQAENVVLALSKFLRYNIYNQDKFVPFKEDVEHIRDFMTLHKARFQERMKYDIDVDETAGEVYVPKFFIQPFVENSIKYGFRIRDNFFINVKARVIEERLCVEITDNGGGMTAEKFSEVREKLCAEQYPDDHIGLYNINKTMRIIYGDAYDLELDNRENVGLTVKIVIPSREL